MSAELKSVVDWNLHKELVLTIWKNVGVPVNNDWALPKKSTLKFIDSSIVENIYSIEDSNLRNRRLREILEPYLNRNLRKKDEWGEEFDELKLKVAKWIVVKWGRIPKSPNAIDSWMESLRHFDDYYVNNFINRMKTERISSWSKILSFYNHKKYAIYDSRTSISLNIAMHQSDINYRFFMPQPRSSEVPKAMKLIKKYRKDLNYKNRTDYLDYPDYLELLNAFVKYTDAVDMLDAEMRLFGNSIEQVEKFMENNKN